MELTVFRSPLPGWPRVLALGGLAIGAGIACGAVAVFVNPLYAVAGALAVIIGVIVSMNVRLAGLAFVAVATLLPYGVAPVPIGGVRPTFIDITVTLLLAIWVLRLLSRQESQLVTTPMDGPLLVLVGLAIAAFIFGTAYALTAESARLFAKLMNSTLFFFSVTQLVRDRRDLRSLTLALIGGGTLAAIIGIALYHLSPEPASSILRSLRPLGYPGGEVLRYVEDSGVRTKTLRAIGTSIDPNVFGGLLLMTGALAGGELLATWRRSWRWLAPAFALICYGLLVSLSRGSWLGLGVALAILTLVRYRRALLLVPVAAVPALVLFGDRLAVYGEHLLKAVFARDQATGMRLGEYKDALTLIQQNPFLGVGFGAAPSSDLYLGVSSTYLLIAEEMGITGLLVFLIVVGTAVVVGVRAYRRGPESTRAETLTYVAVFSGVLVAAIFDHHYFDLRYQHIAALFWMLAAMVVLSARMPPADNQPEEPRAARGGASGGGALAAVGHARAGGPGQPG